MTVSTRTYHIYGRENYYGCVKLTNDLDLPGAANAFEIVGFDPDEEYTITVSDDRRVAKVGERIRGVIGVGVGPVFLDTNIEPDYSKTPSTLATIRHFGHDEAKRRPKPPVLNDAILEQAEWSASTAADALASVAHILRRQGIDVHG